jgi:hypothetical protein
VRTPRPLAVAALAAAAAVAIQPTAVADSDHARVGFGQLFHDGDTVRTVATPTSMPGQGVDAIYAFGADAAAGQLSVTSVAPGSPGYHGGRWAVYVVDWSDSVTATLLTSDEAVLAAAATGDVTVTRMPAADFVCPVTGGR